MPLKVVRRKGTTTLYIRGRVRGQGRIFEATGTSDPEAAEAIRIHRESELLNRSIFGAGATITFAEAAASYVTNGGEAKYIGTYDKATGKSTLLLGELGLMTIAAIGKPEADAAADKLYPGTRASTRNRQVYGPIISILNHAARKWEISVKKIQKPKEKKPITDFATPAYVTALLPHCAPQLRRFVMMLAYTGERLEKITGIDWDKDVDLSTRSITFQTTKNGEMRTIHIPDPLLIELAMVPEEDRHGPMFHWSDKRHVHKPLRSACKRAGLRYLSPHKLGRHTFATWLRRYAGRDLKGLMEDGGWKSINSVVRYAHVVAGETAAAVDLLPSVQSGCNSDVKPIKDRRIRKKSG